MGLLGAVYIGLKSNSFSMSKQFSSYTSPDYKWKARPQELDVYKPENRSKEKEKRAS